MTTYDVLGGPGRDAPRRVPRRLLAVLALLAALAWSGDRWARARELDRLGGRGSPALRASLFGNLGHDAARWTPQVDERRRAVAAVSVLPWHSGLRRARAAYLARVQGWSEYLSQVQLDPAQRHGPRLDLRHDRDIAAVALAAVAGDRRDVARLATALRGGG